MMIKDMRVQHKMKRWVLICLGSTSLTASMPIALAHAAQAGGAAVAQAPRDESRGVLSFSQALSKSLPAVVRIIIIGPSPNGGSEGVIGSGSGVVIDAARGEILTNNHVVQPATKLQVQLTDGRTVDAQLVGRDAASDIALIKVKIDGLTAIPRAPLEPIRVGDIAFAVGYPLGLDQTLTMGVVSGLGRSGIGEGLEDYIQTDASINSGNSGGALLDSQGRLIGVSAAILSVRQGGSIGIGFAIPTQMAFAVADQLRQYGEVRRGRLGVTIEALTVTKARELGLPSTRGALIAGVEAGSPAARAGLSAGDVIAEINGRTIDSPGNLSSVVGIARPGDRLAIGYLRRGQRQSASIEVAAPQPTQVAAGNAATPGTIFGASVRDLRPGDPFPQGAIGALLITVPPGSKAANRGLQAGDLIVGLNGQPVANVGALNRGLQAVRGPVQLIVARGNSLQPVVIN